MLTEKKVVGHFDGVDGVEGGDGVDGGDGGDGVDESGNWKEM